MFNVYKYKFCKTIIRLQFKSFSNLFTTQTFREPEEYRTIFIEHLPQDWSKDEIKVRLEQIGPLEKLHLIKNSIGENTGRGKISLFI